MKTFDELDKVINEAWCCLKDPDTALLKAYRAETTITKLCKKGYSSSTRLMELADELSIIYEYFGVKYDFPYAH